MILLLFKNFENILKKIKFIIQRSQIFTYVI